MSGKIIITAFALLQHSCYKSYGSFAFRTSVLNPSEATEVILTRKVRFMPPKNIRTVRQLIYWEYSKLIAGSVVRNRKNYAFVMHCYKKMDSGQMSPSTILRENKLLVIGDKVCIYCEIACDDLQWEHIIPRSLGGADTIDNMVLACKGCNLSKGTRDIFEWYGKEKQYEIPRLVLGKYLKLIFELHERARTLDVTDLNADGTLDVFDLGAVLTHMPGLGDARVLQYRNA